MVQTTCFALANLAARASESQLHAFMAAGITPRLLRHLKDKTVWHCSLQPHRMIQRGAKFLSHIA